MTYERNAKPPKPQNKSVVGLLLTWKEKRLFNSIKASLPMGKRQNGDVVEWLVMRKYDCTLIVADFGELEIYYRTTAGVSASTKDRIQQLAAKSNTTVCGYIRTMLDEYRKEKSK